MKILRQIGNTLRDRIRNEEKDAHVNYTTNMNKNNSIEQKNHIDHMNETQIVKTSKVTKRFQDRVTC